jgi:hypothetical protein
MKRSIITFFFFLPFILTAQNVSVETIRNEYYKLNTDSIACAKLYAKLSKQTSSDNLINGYKGAVSASMANHVKSPQEKIKLFSAGKQLIEQSIKTDSANVELRFLRLTIQTNCPKALGYYKQIKADRKYISDHFDSVKSATVKKRMSEYLLATKLLTEEEKKKINSGKQ